jgi:4-aminobutyrate aminotransferase-like enzyme/Ser/Thr protein kinase RdoA (MazF antagonist)/murein DD-endopeptidase MepM/ murein hydrolase activator NlpD
VAQPTTEEEAEDIARSRFGVEARARALPGEYDDNFHLAVEDGPGYVLKVMHPQRERGLVELQCAALSHLARRAPALALPRVVAAPGGEAIAAVSDPRGEGSRLAWMLTFVAGETLAGARPRSLGLLESVGRLVGEVDRGLEGFSHPAARRDLAWDLSRAGELAGALDLVEDEARRAIAREALARFDSGVRPVLSRLRRAVIHGDANDHNVILGSRRDHPRSARSLVDFGDMHEGLLVAEPAVAAAYAAFSTSDPVEAIAAVVKGYHAVLPLDELEIELVLPLVAARLATSVLTAARRKGRRPDDAYVAVSEAPAWQTLERLLAVHPRLAHYRVREACGRSPLPGGVDAVAALSGAATASVLGLDLRRASVRVLDLGVGSRFTGASPASIETGPLTERIFAEMKRAGTEVGVGRYDEARAFYTGSLFGGEDPLAERRTVHLGIDLFVEAGTPVQAALDGEVHVLATNPMKGDYGPLVILRHAGPRGVFFTLYGHLDEKRPEGLARGRRVAAGETIGRVGSPPTNGDWPPHLHFQVILDLLDADADFPGVALASQREVWKALSPDPNVLLRLPAAALGGHPPPPSELLDARRRRLGPNLSLSYRKPLEIVRGFGAWLYDQTGRGFLDAYNNVPLVGHSHPRVVEAAARQLALLNTNTRYLHENAVRYAERLLARLPEPLRIVYLLSSGSEAGELALRLARTHTRREDLIVLEHAYHGNTTTLVDVSPYKFAGPGGGGRKPWVHVAPLPDPYRGPHRRDDPEAGDKYASRVGDIVERLLGKGRAPAAFLSETLPSVPGQVVFPPGYLKKAYALVRAAGGVCIADEVQTGFGRLGTHFWGFETQDAVPDVVVLGKPIGNGFPLAAVVTTREIAASFDNGMEFFSTFGGNPVASAVGLAVMEVLEEERLQERALRVGGRLAEGLRALMDRHPLVGDVRGSGLYLGVELVRDRDSLEPAREEAAYVVERMRERGVLSGTDGPHESVLKLRPPLVLSEGEADLVVRELDLVLAEDGARP